MLELTRQLATRNKFNFGRSKVFNQLYLSKQEQTQLILEIEEVGEPFLYERHVHMIDFNRFVYAT